MLRREPGRMCRSVPIRDLASYLELSEKTVYNRVGKLGDEFRIEDKMVIRLEPQENQDSEDNSGEP